MDCHWSLGKVVELDGAPLRSGCRRKTPSSCRQPSYRYMFLTFTVKQGDAMYEKPGADGSRACLC